MALRSPGEFKTLSVDRSFYEKGYPAIHMSGRAFVYTGGDPVTRIEDVEWLPEPFRTQALAFLKSQEA